MANAAVRTDHDGTMQCDCICCERKRPVIAKLRSLLPPGTTVYCILRHVSRSGMSRVIDPFILYSGRPFYLRRYVRDLGIGRIDRKHDGVVVGGCGMDMAHWLVYGIASIVYRDGFGCTGEECRSNDHANGDNDYTPHPYGDVPYGGSGIAFAHWHRDGGYALRAEWV